MHSDASPIQTGPLRAWAIRVGAGSHHGLVREENQDRISRCSTLVGELFLVVDGMGGHAAGGLAAELAVRTFEHAFTYTLMHGLEASAAEAIETAARAANQALLEQASRVNAGSGSPASETMGATFVLALVQPADPTSVTGHCMATVAHLGDSRAYHFHAGALERLTRDHTRVQALFEQGILSAQQARDHPQAHVVERALGHRSAIEVEVRQPFRLAAGDRLLLATDGLTDMVEDAAIAACLAAQDDAQTAAADLIVLANEAGGEDNISVQVIHLATTKADTAMRPRRVISAPGSPATENPVTERPIAVGLSTALVAGLLLISIAALILVAIWLPR